MIPKVLQECKAGITDPWSAVLITSRQWSNLTSPWQYNSVLTFVINRNDNMKKPPNEFDDTPSKQKIAD